MNRKLLSLLVTLVAMFGCLGSLQAQNIAWTNDGNPNGQFYLYSVKTGYFLCGGKGMVDPASASVWHVESDPSIVSTIEGIKYYINITSISADVTTTSNSDKYIKNELIANGNSYYSIRSTNEVNLRVEKNAWFFSNEQGKEIKSTLKAVGFWSNLPQTCDESQWYLISESQMQAYRKYLTAWNNLNPLYQSNKDIQEIKEAIEASTDYTNAVKNTKTLEDLYNKYSSTFKNPISNKDMADPSVILGDDGYYYVYCSEHYQGEGICVYQSADMINWNEVNKVFPSSNRPSELGYTFLWAPEIKKIGNKYVLYIANAAWGDQGNTQICVATSDKPYGPFEFKKVLFSAHGPNGTNANVDNCIDPSVFEDNGTKYLVWGSWHGIYYWQLSDDGLSLVGDKQKISTDNDGDWTGIEAPMIFKHDKYYYLIASKGATAGQTDPSKINYRLVMARSTSLTGTYVDVNNKNVFGRNGALYGLLESNDYVLGPGHCSNIITDKNGCEWIFYHGYGKKDGNWDLNTGRILFASKIWWGEWNEGWPGILPPAADQNLIVPNVDAPIDFYSRSGLVDGGYYTICLPYASKSTENASFYEIAGTKKVDGEITGIYLNECEEPLVAGRPYIFQASGETMKVYYDGLPYIGTSCEYNGLVGNLISEKIQVPTGNYFFKTINTIAKTTSDDPNVAGVRAKIAENRAYLDLSEIEEYSPSVGSAKAIFFGFDGSTEITSIDGITSLNREENAVYNIMGQRVGANAKGILIKNGKKIFVK